MIEHRLIEKTLVLTGKQLEVMKKSHAVDPIFIDTVVDYIRTYADRTHHGKEEDILFREFKKRNWTPGIQRSCRSWSMNSGNSTE